jgi:hypothetical protein
MDEDILRTRCHIARELGLSVSILHPEDDLVWLVNKYCLVLSGDIALGDLYDDLFEENRQNPQPFACPETVREYIEAAIKN